MSKGKELIKRPPSNVSQSIAGRFLKARTRAELTKVLIDETAVNIYIATFKGLQLRNLHFEDAEPLLIAYANECANYINIMATGEPPVLDGARGDVVVNPMRSLANRSLANIQSLAKLLAIDPYSRTRTGAGPEPESRRKKKKGEFDEL